MCISQLKETFPHKVRRFEGVLLGMTEPKVSFVGRWRDRWLYHAIKDIVSQK